MAKTKTNRTTPRTYITETELSTPALPRGRCYLCIGPNVWGKAFTALQAWENAGKPDRFIMHDAPPDMVITEDGQSEYVPALYYEPEEDNDATNTPRVFTPIGYRAKELYRFPAGLK